MDIEQLTRYENVLMGKTPSLSASEQNNSLLRDLRWEDIAREYLALARDHGDLEALKRAIFLIWYQVAEPDWVTGIGSIEPETIRKVFQLADDVAKKGQLDEEIIWMLPYYYMIAQWYLPPEYDALKEASMENKDQWRTGCLASSFCDRGQLGEYWIAVVTYLRSGGTS